MYSDVYGAEYSARTGIPIADLRRLSFLTIDEPRGVEVGPDHYADGAVVCAGLEFAHRLTAREIADGAVSVTPDWWHAAVVGATEPGFALGGVSYEQVDVADDGIERKTEYDYSDGNVFVFRDPAALAAFGPGDLVGLRWNDGAFATSAWTRGRDESADQQLADLMDVHLKGGYQLDLADLFAHFADAHRGVLEAITLPMSELLAAAGYAWTTYETVRHVEDSERVPELGIFDDPDDFEIGESAAGPELPEAGRILLALAESLTERPDSLPPAALLEVGGWDELAECIADLRSELVVRRVSATALAEAIDALYVKAPRSARPLLEYLRGVSAEWSKDLVAAQAHWERAALDGAVFEAFADLMRLAFMRGDYVHAAELWGKILDGEPFFAEFAQAAGPELGRNERCWCGSGRKYKACHLGKPRGFSLAERTPLLITKLGDVARDPDFALAISAVTQLQPEGAFSDSFYLQFCLFEFGGISCYRYGIGQLLPADEAALVDEWAGLKTTLYEVVDVSPVRLRDVRTGHRFDIRNADPIYTLGGYLTAVLAPDSAGEYFTVAPHPVQPTAVDEVLAVLDARPAGPDEDGDVDGPAFADWFISFLTTIAPSMGGQAIVTKDGSPLEPCEVEITTTAPVRLRKLLTREYEQAADGSDHWLVLDSARSVRGSITGPGPGDPKGRFRVESMSRDWLDDILDALQDAEPKLAVGPVVAQAWFGGDDGDDAGSATAQSAQSAQPGDSMFDPSNLPPEIQALMVEQIAKYEAAWIDETIPALGNRTPRACVADPTRRDDVIRLLATFGETDDPLQMSPNRLRDLLGLPRVTPTGGLGRAFGD